MPLGLTGIRETGLDGWREKVVGWGPVPVERAMPEEGFKGTTTTVVGAGSAEDAAFSFAALPSPGVKAAPDGLASARVAVTTTVETELPSLSEPEEPATGAIPEEPAGTAVEVDPES